MVNFAVYRQCLFEHADGEFDPDHPNATICKPFRYLARNTCPPRILKKYYDQVARDNYVGMKKLSSYKAGKNPAVITIDSHNNIIEVHNLKEGGEFYQKGLNLEDYDL